MEKKTPTYDDFLLDVSPLQRPMVDAVDAFLRAHGCVVRVTPAKSGYVVSYDRVADGKVIANYVFRKKGLIIRIYGNHVEQYPEVLGEMPDAMQKAVAKAPICRRLHDPTKCNARCPMGNVFMLAGEEHKKCRYSNFMFLLDEESTPAVLGFLERELDARSA